MGKAQSSQQQCEPIEKNMYNSCAFKVIYWRCGCVCVWCSVQLFFSRSFSMNGVSGRAIFFSIVFDSYLLLLFLFFFFSLSFVCSRCCACYTRYMQTYTQYTCSCSEKIYVSTFKQCTIYEADIVFTGWAWPFWELWTVIGKLIYTYVYVAHCTLPSMVPKYIIGYALHPPIRLVCCIVCAAYVC